MLSVTLPSCGAKTLYAFDDGGGRDAFLDGGGVPIDGAPSDFGPPGRDMEVPPPPPPDCVRDADCLDGLGCNGNERCVAGSCVAGVPVYCEDDGVACTVEACDEVAPNVGACGSTPDPSRCAGDEVCTAMGCRRRPCRSDAECDDGSFCSGVEICVRGLCRSTMRPTCDDDDACTVDRCSDLAGRCVHGPRDDDGDGAVNAACGGDDCNDVDPAVRPGAPEVCDNRIDDDCDGRADCEAPRCAREPVCAGPPPPPPDGGAREMGVAACTNRVDDDLDGRIDCADPDCRPFGPDGECCNGVDDTPGNDDPNYDLFACRCFSDADCVGIGSVETSCWRRSFSVCGPRCDFLGGNFFCRMFFPGSLERCDFASGECVP